MTRKSSLNVTFRHMQHSGNLMKYIEREVHSLHRRHYCIESCRVIVEKQHRRHHSGNSLCAKVLVSVPGKQIFSSRETAIGSDNEEVLGAVHSAFDAAETIIDSYVHSSNRHRSPNRCALKYDTHSSS